MQKATAFRLWTLLKSSGTRRTTRKTSCDDALVYIGLADAHGCRVEELRLDPTLSRDEIRQRTAEAAIELLSATLA